MTDNANSVNIEKKPYHHGGLRSALIAEGLRLLAERDAESLSLREVARNAGVTATSVYRHFPDKKALMAALAGAGFESLAQAQADAAQAAGPGLEGFAATGRAYVRFALANPALFRVMFTSADLVQEISCEDGAVSAMAMLQANAAAATGAPLDDPETQIEVLRAWAIVHGLAMLMLDNQIPTDDGLIDRVISVEVVGRHGGA